MGGDQAAAHFSNSLYSLKQPFFQWVFFSPAIHSVTSSDSWDTSTTTVRTHSSQGHDRHSCLQMYFDLINHGYRAKVVQSKVIRKLHENHHHKCILIGRVYFLYHTITTTLTLSLLTWSKCISALCSATPLPRNYHPIAPRIALQTQKFPPII